MIFHPFCTRDKDISYLLADPVTRHAAVVDPHTEAAREYVELIRRLDLKLMYLIETHAHESHLSAAPSLREETGARLLMHRSMKLDCVDRHVTDGETIFMGEEYIAVMETPGHSACSLSFLWRDRVFTGHTLLAGATGLCRRADADAGQLFDSVRERLFALPDETLVCPGREAHERRISSIGQERKANRDIQPQTSRMAFIQKKQAEATRTMTWRQDKLAANRGGEYMN